MCSFFFEREQWGVFLFNFYAKNDLSYLAYRREPRAIKIESD